MLEVAQFGSNRGRVMKKDLVLIMILGSLISCGSFDWSAFNQSMANSQRLISTQYLVSELSGGIIIAEDGTYLGKIANKYDSESIFNKYGKYGSEYSAASIWNRYGIYGSKYSLYSAFNPYTITPPKIYKNGSLIGYLTVNKYLANSINPYLLLGYF